MLPGNFQALAAVLLAVAPGYIATVVWARARTWKGSAGDLKTILQSLALSGVVQLVLAPLTLLWLYPVHRNLGVHPIRLTVWLVLVVLVVPALLGALAGYVSDRLFDPARGEQGWIARWIAKLIPAPAPPSIWDWLFTARPPNGLFLVIEFKDGKRVAGVFSEGSLAITSPEPQGLFLTTEWILNEQGDVVGPVPDSRGLMMMDVQEIRSVRLLQERSDG